MIITRTPFRIPLAGGGTDLDFYYKLKGGKLISSTFNQFMYVLLADRPVDEKILIQTTSIQFTEDPKKIKHTIIKEVLKFFKIKKKIQVSTFSTLPTGSGIGSSSALIVGLIVAILELKKVSFSKAKIAKTAYFIERIILKLKGGWQDQIIAAHGGVQLIKISKKGHFNLKSIKADKNLIKIEKKLILIFTNKTRNSSKSIFSQKNNLKKTLEQYDAIKSLVPQFRDAIKMGDYQKIGKIFHYHWIQKKKLSKFITNTKIDKMYISLLREKSFIGGKLMGAGGGGFILMVSNNMKRSLLFLNKRKMNYTKFKFTFEGSKVIQGYNKKFKNV
jgi:D-glycero-alpha-D-manno-heptose-7-phosphate kinase